MTNTKDAMATCRPVYRYTVDNRYGNDVVILVVAPLVHGRTSFTDDTKDWEDEKLRTGRPAELVKELKVPGEGGPVDADLQPGRVFLRGSFKEVPAEDPTCFEVIEDAPVRWLRIDQLRLAKEPVKQLYSKLLAGSDSDD